MMLYSNLRGVVVGFSDGFGLGFILGILLSDGVMVFEEQGCGAGWWMAAAVGSLVSFLSPFLVSV